MKRASGEEAVERQREIIIFEFDISANKFMKQLNIKW